MEVRYKLVFNESAFNIVSQIPSGMEMSFVTVLECKKYVETVNRNNYIFLALAFMGLFLSIYVLYKNGVYWREAKAIKKLFANDEDRLAEEMEKLKIKIFMNKTDDQIIEMVKEWKVQYMMDKKKKKGGL